MGSDHFIGIKNDIMTFVCLSSNGEVALAMVRLS